MDPPARRIGAKQVRPPGGVHVILEVLLCRRLLADVGLRFPRQGDPARAMEVEPVGHAGRDVLRVARLARVDDPEAQRP